MDKDSVKKLVEFTEELTDFISMVQVNREDHENINNELDDCAREFEDAKKEIERLDTDPDSDDSEELEELKETRDSCEQRCEELKTELSELDGKLDNVNCDLVYAFEQYTSK